MPINLTIAPTPRAIPGGGGIPGWVMPGAVIDEDFAGGRYYPRSIATELADSRASDQYVTTAGGVLVKKSPSELSISDAGLLIEPAATNLLVQSNGLTASPWANGGVPAGAVLTANALAGVDGLVTATRAVAPAVSGANNYYVTLDGFTATAADYQCSIYLRGVVGGEQVYLMATPDGVAYRRTLATLTTAWQRFTLNAAGLTAATWFFQVGVDLRDAGQSAKAAQTYYLQHAQAELGSAPSSYFATAAAAAARAANAVTLQRTGIGRMVFTFDDNSQQTVAGINTAAAYALPTSLNRRLIKRMTGYAS